MDKKCSRSHSQTAAVKLLLDSGHRQIISGSGHCGYMMNTFGRQKPLFFIKWFLVAVLMICRQSFEFVSDSLTQVCIRAALWTEAGVQSISQTKEERQVTQVIPSQEAWPGLSDGFPCPLSSLTLAWQRFWCWWLQVWTDDVHRGIYGCGNTPCIWYHFTDERCCC